MKDGWCRRSLAWLLACGMGVVGGLAVAQPPSSPPAHEKGASAPTSGKLTGPQPAWVTPLTVPTVAQAAADEVRQGVHYLLSDAQVRVDGKQRQSYRHFAMKAVNEKGVESIANIELRFDPAYERLTLHTVTVIRGGRRIERLPGLELRVIQREKDLDYLIFDGSKSVHAFLDDVRVGDVVEYAYTVSGSNPVFGERFFGAFDLQWGSPVGRVQARLLWPAGRPLHIKSLNGAPEAVKGQVDGQEEYVWHRQGQDGLQPSPDAPGWYDPYAQVQWGDFGSWADVARWAVPLYQVPDGLSPALQSEVRRIAALGTDPKLRTAEALRLVQREVRYLGVEVGAGSHAPNAPNLVFKRRFGDCKDKTVLTLALLKALGVKAQAALVHTQQRRTLARQLPRPSVFNHVLVRADIGGRAYWLDPTRATQPGPLDSLGQPDFERALLVDPASTDLTTVEPGAAMLHKRQVAMRIDASAGLTEPARMTVTTTLEGVSAEQMRASLASETAAELQKRYLNYYARSYPGIAVALPMEVQDGVAQAGRMTVVEHYQVKNFFARADERHRLEASLEVPEVLGQLQAPREAIRNAPLALSHPQELQHELEVLLPERWTIQGEQEEIKDAAFSLRRTVQGEDRRLLIRDDFRSLAGHVEPQDAATYAADIDKARKLVGYVIYKGDATSASATTSTAAQGAAQPADPAAGPGDARRVREARRGVASLGPGAGADPEWLHRTRAQRPAAPDGPGHRDQWLSHRPERSGGIAGLWPGPVERADRRWGRPLSPGDGAAAAGRVAGAAGPVRRLGAAGPRVLQAAQQRRPHLARLHVGLGHLLAAGPPRHHSRALAGRRGGEGRAGEGDSGPGHRGFLDLVPAELGAREEDLRPPLP